MEGEQEWLLQQSSRVDADQYSTWTVKSSHLFLKWELMPFV